MNKNNLRGKVASTGAERRILGKKSTNQKEVGPTIISPVDQPPKCPQCSNDRVWKDGTRSTNNGEVQRWLCRACGYRFSQSKEKLDVSSQVFETLDSSKNHLNSRIRSTDFSIKKALDQSPFSFSENVGSHELSSVSTVEKRLNTLPFYNRNRRVCASEGEAKNLVAVETRLEKAAGATKTEQETLKGLLVRYCYWLEKEGYCQNTEYPKLIRRLAQRGANLLDPENVKAVIMKQPWKNGTKILGIYAYDAMTKMLNIEWTLPKLRQEERLPWIPEEKELDALIVSCQSKQIAAFLQTLKETFADPGEALKLRWIDISASNNTITINRPVKGHNPRQLKVSSKLIAMLNALPKKSELIFPRNYRQISNTFRTLRRRIAVRLQNPRLRSISLTTFRHWGATMTYHYTRDILLVQKLLGHKHIENTMKYTQLVSFKDNEFDVGTALSVEEAKQLLATGFDYVTEKNGIMLFRRPKRFGG